eukprot:gene12879-5999_t
MKATKKRKSRQASGALAPYTFTSKGPLAKRLRSAAVQDEDEEDSSDIEVIEHHQPSGEYVPDPKSIEQAQQQYNRKNIVIHKRRKAEMIGKDLKRDCPYCNCSGQMYDCDACNKIRIAQIIANRDNIGALERMGAWIEKSKSEELHASCDVKQKASYSSKLRSKVITMLEWPPPLHDSNETPNTLASLTPCECGTTLSSSPCTTKTFSASPP